MCRRHVRPQGQTPSMAPSPSALSEPKVQTLLVCLAARACLVRWPGRSACACARRAHPSAASLALRFILASGRRQVAAQGGRDLAPPAPEPQLQALLVPLNLSQGVAVCQERARLEGKALWQGPIAPQADAPDLKARGHQSVGVLVRGHHFREQHPQPLLLPFRAVLECTAPPSPREDGQL